jgi:hypothetical protein
MVSAAPGLAAPSAAPLLAGRTELSGRGNVSVALDVPEAFQIDPGDPGISLDFSGSWAAFFLVRQDAGRVPKTPYTLGGVFAKPSAGCAAHGDPRVACPDPRGLVLRSYAPRSVTSTGTGVFVGSSGTVRLNYPAGRYVAYLMTAPSAAVHVTFTVHGMSGRTALVARTPVSAKYLGTTIPGNGVLASTSGALTQRFRRYGALIDRTWTANKPDTQYNNSVSNVCLLDGAAEEQRQSVVAEGEYCPYSAEFDGLLGDTPFTRRSEAATGGTDGSTYGFSTYGIDAALVRPGTYTAAYAARDLGDDPQVGAAMLSWEYVY